MTDDELQVLRNYRAMDERTKKHYASVGGRLAKMFPARLRPTLRLVAGKLVK